MKILQWIRFCLKEKLFFCLRKIGNTDEAKTIMTDILGEILCKRPNLSKDIELVSSHPYKELGKSGRDTLSSHRDDVIIITARFRSGSTLLWNIYRNIEGCTAYFEPFHPRRPFDPLTRGNYTSPSHRKVSDYWQEYDGLEELGTYFNREWHARNLLMTATAWNPDMKRYVELLIEKAPGRPVLQFNRIDFRLPWFRQHFPRATFIHLYRHPRDQWYSSLRNPKIFTKTSSVAEFAQHDHYSIREWAFDLKPHFPFLDWKVVSHPYEMFYFLWKLSYVFGVKYSHYSMAFENLIEDSEKQLEELCRVSNIKMQNIERMKSVIVRVPVGQWKEYADDEWFRKYEEKCETILEKFLVKSHE
jgi:hypothetical protein